MTTEPPVALLEAEPIEGWPEPIFGQQSRPFEAVAGHVAASESLNGTEVPGYEVTVIWSERLADSFEVRVEGMPAVELHGGIAGYSFFTTSEALEIEVAARDSGFETVYTLPWSVRPEGAAPRDAELPVLTLSQPGQEQLVLSSLPYAPCACALDSLNQVSCTSNCGGETPTERFERLVTAREELCGIEEDGDLLCWGAEPGERFRVEGPVEDAVVGYRYACSTDASRRLTCQNFEGELDPSAPNRAVLDFDVGASVSCAINDDGVGNALNCWENSSYSPGSQQWSEGLMTTPEASLSSVVISSRRACGRAADGAIICWGEGGQRTLPPADYVEIYPDVVGDDCALRNDGVLICSGSDGPAGPVAAGVRRLAHNAVYAFVLYEDGALQALGDERPNISPFRDIVLSDVVLDAGTLCGRDLAGAVACATLSPRLHPLDPPGGPWAPGPDEGLRVRLDTVYSLTGVRTRSLAWHARWRSVEELAREPVRVRVDNRPSLELPPSSRGVVFATDMNAHRISVSSGSSVAEAAWFAPSDPIPARMRHQDHSRLAIGRVGASVLDAAGNPVEYVRSRPALSLAAPAPMPEGTYASLRGSDEFRCALSRAGELVCAAWEEVNEVPAGLPESGVSDFRVVDDVLCWLAEDGEIQCVGGRLASVTPPPGPFRGLALGDGVVCGVRGDGNVACWTEDGWRGNVFGETLVRDVHVEGHVPCAVRRDGHLECWRLPETADSIELSRVGPPIASDGDPIIDFFTKNLETWVLHDSGRVDRLNAAPGEHHPVGRYVSIDGGGFEALLASVTGELAGDDERQNVVTSALRDQAVDTFALREGACAATERGEVFCDGYNLSMLPLEARETCASVRSVESDFFRRLVRPDAADLSRRNVVRDALESALNEPGAWATSLACAGPLTESQREIQQQVDGAVVFSYEPLVNELGFQPGDVLVAMDGEPLVSLDDLQPFVQRLLDEETIEVEKRGRLGSLAYAFGIAEASPVVLPEIPDDASPGYLSVSSSPRGVVVVDGQSTGVWTPARRIPMAPGPHDVQIAYNGDDEALSEVRVAEIRQDVNTNVFFRESQD